jgi:hypothetical protein
MSRDASTSHRTLYRQIDQFTNIYPVCFPLCFACMPILATLNLFHGDRYLLLLLQTVLLLLLSCQICPNISDQMAPPLQNNQKLDRARAEQLLEIPRKALHNGDAYLTFHFYRGPGMPGYAKPCGQYSVFFYQTRRVVRFDIEGHHDPLPKVMIPPRAPAVKKASSPAKPTNQYGKRGRSPTVETETYEHPGVGRGRARAPSPARSQVSVSVVDEQTPGVEAWLHQTARTIMEDVPADDTYSQSDRQEHLHDGEDSDMDTTTDLQLERANKIRRTETSSDCGTHSEASNEQQNDADMELDNEEQGATEEVYQCPPSRSGSVHFDKESLHSECTRSNSSSSSSDGTVRGARDVGRDREHSLAPSSSSVTDFRSAHPRPAAFARASSRGVTPMSYMPPSRRSTSRTPGFDTLSVDARSEFSADLTQYASSEHSYGSQSSAGTHQPAYELSVEEQDAFGRHVNEAADAVNNIHVDEAMLEGTGALYSRAIEAVAH